MKILVIDTLAAGLDFSLRCKQAGHEVKLFIAPKSNDSDTGRGIVDKVKEWQPWMRWADLIFLVDNNMYMREIETYHKLGYPIFGGNLAGTELELNREAGQNAFKKHGIKIMPYKTFNNYDQAIAFVDQSRKRYVSKPSADADKALSYVSRDAKDMICRLDAWKRLGKIRSPFILQEFVKGIEMAVGGWYGPAGFNKAINENWEHKKHLNSDLGVNTGEQGTVMRYVLESKLFDETLAKLEPMLKKIKYVGYIDVAVMIDPDTGEIRPLEFTTRPGWPHFNIHRSLVKGDPATWMYDLIHGHDSLEVSPDIAVGVVLTTPNYPYVGPSNDHFKNIPVWCNPRDKDIHVADVKAGLIWDEVDDKIVRIPGWVQSGSYVADVTGKGPNVGTAMRRVYKKLKEDIHVPNSVGYRTDIGLRLKKQLPEFQKFGFATGMEF